MSGGGPSAPEDHSLELERMRQEREDAQAIAAKQDAADKKAAALSQAIKQRDLTKKTAFESLQDKFSNKGLDPTTSQYQTLSERVSKQLNDLFGILPSDDPDALNKGIASIDPSKLVDDAVNSDLTNTRRNLSRTVANYYNPINMNSYIDDTADDGVIDSIIGSKADENKTMLERAFKRGTLNDSGYSAALKELENQSAAGKATFNSLGQTILNEGRAGFQKVGDTYKTKASAYNYDPDIDVNKFGDTVRGALDSYLNNFKSGLEGRIRAATAGADPFDFSKLLAAGGIAQGPQATGTSGVDPVTGASVLAGNDATNDVNKATKRDSRGIGSQGTF